MEVNMKDLHLVPVNIQDIADKLGHPTTGYNERLLLEKRLEVIRDYINITLNNHLKNRPKNKT